jgi:hypothetical protein
MEVVVVVEEPGQEEVLVLTVMPVEMAEEVSLFYILLNIKPPIPYSAPLRRRSRRIIKIETQQQAKSNHKSISTPQQ